MDKFWFYTTLELSVNCTESSKKEATKKMNYWRLCSWRTFGKRTPHSLSTTCSTRKITTTDDKSTFVAWHPKEDFPYEYTKALPETVYEDTSPLKTQMTPQLKEIFNKKTPEQAIQELMNITHTTKHRWYPRSRDKKAKKTPMDREYL